MIRVKGGCGRGFHLPWISTRPISSPLPPLASDQSSNFVEIHHSSPPSKSINLFQRLRRFSTRALRHKKLEPWEHICAVAAAKTRFYLHLAGNSRFPSRFNLFFSVSPGSALEFQPPADFGKGWIKYWWAWRQGKVFQEFPFVRHPHWGWRSRQQETQYFGSVSSFSTTDTARLGRVGREIVMSWALQWGCFFVCSGDTAPGRHATGWAMIPFYKYDLLWRTPAWEEAWSNV